MFFREKLLNEKSATAVKNSPYILFNVNNHYVIKFSEIFLLILSTYFQKIYSRGVEGD